MDITALAGNLAQTGIMKQVGVAILSDSIEQAEVSGQQLVNMIDAASMEHSVTPSIGGNLDLKV